MTWVAAVAYGVHWVVEYNTSSIVSRWKIYEKKTLVFMSYKDSWDYIYICKVVANNTYYRCILNKAYKYYYTTAWSKPNL